MSRGFFVGAAAAVLIVASADGSNQRKLATRKRPAVFPLLGVAWSPDGKTIAATGSHDGQLRGELVTVDVATGAEHLVATPDWRGCPTATRCS